MQQNSVILPYVTFEQAQKLMRLDFYCHLSTMPRAYDNNGEECNWTTGHFCAWKPTVAEALKWMRDKKGLYVAMQPEFYEDGINFNWQVLWYKPKETWPKRKYEKSDKEYFYHVSSGTYLFGDNGEFPTHDDAEIAALEYCIDHCLGEFKEPYYYGHFKR